MPGASLRKANSAAYGFLSENSQQHLLKRALSTRRAPYDVMNEDQNFLGLRNIEGTKTLSNSANSLKGLSASVKMRKPSDSSMPRPSSLDLSTMTDIVKLKLPLPEELKTTHPEPYTGLVMPKRNHLSLFAPEAAHRAESLRFRKRDRKRALRRSLVRSATIVGETIKAPFGDYLKESWDAFLTKITERQSELQRQAADACDWLIAAGFPQYSHIYKAGDFPLNILSAAKDHVFLEEEQIEAFIKRLSILNKCANLKLDRTLSREVLADQEEEDYEHFAISNRWFLEGNGRRWARIEERESSLDSPALENKIVMGRALVEDHSSTNNGDNNNIVGKSLDNLHTHQDNPSPSGDDSPVTEKPPKQKGSRFLKRFGGDLKKLSSFKKREFLQRSHSADKAQEHSPRSDKLHFSSGRGMKRNHKVVIGQPTLEEGCERVNQMKCVPVHHPACTVHGQHIGRKNSSHSLISTSSSGAGSITSTTGSRTNPSFDGHSCLECSNVFDAISASKKEIEHTQGRNNALYLAPPPHKPGTFPTALREQTEAEEFIPAFSLPSSESSSRSHSASDVTAHWPDSSRKLLRARSIYDNLDEAGLCSITQDFLNIFDIISPVGIDDETDVLEEQVELSNQRVPGVDVAFWSVDDIVEHTQSLQQMVQSWESDEENFGDAVDSMENIAVTSFLSSTDVVPSVSSENASATESETEAVRTNLEQLDQLQTKWETLKRALPVCTDKKIDASQLHSLSAGQLMMLRRLAVLKLTASMEKFTNKASHSWSVPRFIRRFKVPDYKDKTIFGVPLLNNVQQFGQALPPCIQHALEYLRNTSLEQIGIFRKPGVRLRIENLRAKCEENPHFKDFDNYSAFDVADLVKKYFRELPDPLMTMKLSETFVGIFSNICQELRLTILQAAILLLPDENREALKTLLHFLRDVDSNASENQMSASNLSTCLTPSLFHLQINGTKLTSASSSPKLKKSQMGKLASATVMKPNMKEMNDNKAATQCLTFMIENLEAIFKIPEDSTTQCRMSVMHQPEDVLACDIGSRMDAQSSEDYFKDYHAHVDKIVAQTLREEQKIYQNKTGNWQSVPGPQGTEVMYKKMHDGNHLRLWRTKVEINDISPDEVLNKILNERNVWDDNLVQCEVLEQPDNQTQVYQFVVSEMHPHPSRDYCVLRTWRKKPNARGTIVVVESSTNHQPLVGDVRGVVLTSRYVIEPIDSKKCSLVHVCRIDSKGRNPEWYNKAYGYLAAGNLIKIRDAIHSNVCKSAKTG